MSIDGKTHHFCNKCSTEKTIDNFRKASWCTGGYRPTCDDCREEQRMFRVYGVTKEWYLENSKNGCQLCGRIKSGESRRLAIDHCHETGKIRGVLCNSCNTVLGKYFDNQEMFDKFIKYKRKNHES